MASVLNLSPEDVAAIKARLRSGDFQHNIAADYDLNQGRICEINQGRYDHLIALKETQHALDI